MSLSMKKKFPSITSIDVGTDGNTSFLRAARNGQLEKVLEHLESNIDINTSNANGLNALHLASKDGHVEIVEELLKRGAVIDAATKKGNTALHIASLAGQEEVVKLLVNHGASVNVQSQNGFTPLYMAAQENHDNVVKYLLANGANQSLSTEDGFTPLAVAMQQGHDKVVTVLLENDTRGKVRLPALHIAAKKDDVKAAKLLLENEHNPDVTSKSGFTPLHIASHYGNQSIANLLVQKGADVNYAAKHNITPLHVAAKWGKTNMVTVLLEQGANIESKTRDGLTPLHCAARSGHEQVVDMLLEKGAPISSKTKNGLAPLHMAAQGDHVDAARILLYHRAPVDEVTVDYLTALHVAAHCGHVRVAKLLLDRQADANARALNGFTPLHIACKKNRIKVVELLLKHGASIGATTESGLTPLHVASFMGCMNIVIYLLQHDANPDVPTVRGETPLHLAARANQTDIIRILLRNGAQVDARAREQQTPLHIASRLGNVDIVMLLLQHGAKVDNTTKDMYTALHIASKEGQDEVAAALIDNGASLNATTKKGFTPLHLAAKYGHLKVTKLLLQKEAPVDAQGKNGVTPLHVASHYDHQNVALLLLEKGASPYATAKNGHTPLHIAAKKNQMDIANTLLEYGAKPNAESKAGFTPLHLSAQEGHCDMTDLLIEHKADTNHRARNGLTPLHLCAQEDKVPVAEILVKNGGEVDAATKNGYTPLHIASHYGQINMVRFLLSHGANVKATTSLGYTPLHQAAQQGHTNIVNTLLENSAQPNATTNSGQTPLHIAEKLGYITVIDTLKVVTQPASPVIGSTISNEEKYRVVAPEAMHETFMSDSEEEGGEDTVLGDQTYRYLTADEMKSLGDDSLPIDVTRDERIDSNKIICNAENMLPPRNIEDNISPEHVQQNYVEYIKKYTPDNVDIDKHPISIGFLVSFLVDARGGAMRGCRHSGVRVIVPSRCAPSPTRITCRYVRPQRTPHPPPLMEGEALASRVLELGPVGAKFLGPVIIEVPHFAALRGKEREIVILRSDNGESWKEHTVDATEEVLNEVLHDSFEAEDLNQMEDVSSGRITRIVTQDFPQYFAVVSRIRQEVHAIGPEGGMVSSTVVPQVQAVFPQGALTKKIKVGLQAQPIDPELTAKLLGHGVAVSPVVTVEPRRRKFHKAITLSMPAPRAHSQGMINQYSGSAPTLRLLCSITGGTTRAQWEDVTGSTPLTFVNDCVSFTTTVSARFWLMDCRNVGDATKMATELYREAIHVPFMAKFVVFAKRVDPLEARLRVFCMTDDKEDKTLEHQEHFTEVAKSRDVEVLEGKPQYIEFAGNLVPITKSGEQLQFSFRAFRENRLPFSVRVKDQHAEAVSRCLFMREPKMPKGEPPQQPICILNIVLPDDIVVDTISLTDADSLKKIESFDYYRPDPRLADMSNLLGEDWVPLAAQLGLTTSEINVIKSEYPDSVAKQAQSMLRMWLSQSGNKAQANTLESALRRIGREDIIPQCLNVDYPAHGIKEIGKQRLIKKISLEQTLYEKDIMKDSESVESLRRAEEERKKENFDKYSAEEKVVEETSEEEEEEDFNKTVTERRKTIEERLSVDRTVPASSQRVEIVQEISSIKRQSLVENKIAEVEQKAVGEVVDGVKTTITSNELTISPPAEKGVDVDRRDSALLEGVTQRFESSKMITNIVSTEDPKSPKVSKTPPPSPADFITKEQAAAIQDWDVSKKSASQEEAPFTQDAEQQGLSTTTERLVASNEETLLDKPLGPQLTGLSVIDDYLVIDLKTVFDQTNAFIQSESQPEPYDALADKYTRKEPINDKKIDDNKNNMNEKKKAKKGFFGSIKTFVERSFESDSESEKSPKKSKKPKKDKKKKSKDDKPVVEPGLPPRKPKLPTPPLAPSDIDSIPFVEASISDLPPPYKPPDVPSKEEIPVTDLDADLVDIRELEEAPKPSFEVREKEREKTPKPVEVKQKEKLVKHIVETKEKEKPKEKQKKTKTKTVVVEEVTKTIQPLVIEAEEFSIIVDPTKKESPKKSKETFTINIDESVDKKEKEILEKSPILTEEKIVKPLAALEMQTEAPVRPPRVKDHVYEDIEDPAALIPQDHVKHITTDLIQNEINFGGWSDALPTVPEKVDKEEDSQKEIVEKQDKEVLKEKDVKSKAGDDVEGKKKEEKKGGFFGLFKKRDSKKDEDVSIEKIEKVEEVVKKPLSEAVLKDMTDSNKFLLDEVKNYHDVRPTEAVPTEAEAAEVISAVPATTKPEIEEQKVQSEGFFGLFKKPKKEEKLASDKKADSPEKKSKKDDKGKSEEKKVAVILSAEVLKNMLDSKQFLDTEVQNYHDVRTDHVVSKEEKIAKQVDDVRESPPKKIVSKREASPKQAVDERRESSPKKGIEDRRESSPKPGFFGLFKKSKKDEPEVPAINVILSDEVAKDMEDTDQFLIAEIENYHDVKPSSEEVKIEEIVEVVKPAETAEPQSGGFFGLFKKSKKEEETPKPQLSETTIKDMADSNQFLLDEVENYHDVKAAKEESVVEEQTAESAEQPFSGFFGLFKKTKKEDEKIAPEVTKEVLIIKDTSLSVEEKPDKYVTVDDQKIKKVVEEVRESSPKPSAGFFGLFKKSKKDDEETIPIKPPLSDSVLKDMTDTSQFLSSEVENYHDVKPEKFEPIQEDKIAKIVDETVESSPKSSRGLFGIFKKPKKEQEEPPVAKPTISEDALKDMDDAHAFLKEEVDQYHDVKPEKFHSIEQEESVKIVEEAVEASPKSSRGLFSIFKKSKKDQEEVADSKPSISEAVILNVQETNLFLTQEVDNYHDVKPEKFEFIQEEKVSKDLEPAVEASPKSSRGLFGIFKKPKKDQEEPIETKPLISEETETLLTVEVQNYNDLEPTEDDKVVKVVEAAESSPKPLRGLFGIFKKSKKDEEEPIVTKPALSDTVAKEMDDTTQFLVSEVENYHDVKPEKPIEEEEVTKVTEEDVESSPKSSRGLFGIFKKSKKEDDEPTESKVVIPEEMEKVLDDTNQFLTEEVENYHDAKIVKEKVVEVAEEKREAAPRPTSAVFDTCQQLKEKDLEIKAPLSAQIQQEMNDTAQFLSDEVENYHDVKPIISDEVTTIKREIEDVEVRPETKGGFLSKFKITKKKTSLPEVQLSEEVQKDLSETKSFISTEVEKYEDVKVVVTDKDKKEEKIVTFDETKSKMVLEGRLPQPEVAHVVDLVKKDTTDIVTETKDEVKEAVESVTIDVPEVKLTEQETKPSKKDKQGKDKKGFFNIFGKKSKSQDAASDESRGRAEETSEGSPKKQKRRKSSSPFKFFDKMKKSEEDVKELESEIPTSSKIEVVTKEEVESKDDLLAVEFEDQPTMDLSKEVLGSLDRKMEELKSKYTPEVQKQLNDCRDFLFIEVDNYEDAQPVVVTDIDTGLSTDAVKTVDDIIDKAAKTVEVGRDQAEVAKTETVESVTKAASSAEESAKKAAKKADRKSGGFFSKLGSFISGSVDDAKTELKEAKKSAEKTVDKTKDSAQKTADAAAKSVEEGVKKTKEEMHEAKQKVETKVDETKEHVEAVKDFVVDAATEKIDQVDKGRESVLDTTDKKIESAKVGVIEMKDSLFETTAKVGGKVDDLKKDTVDKTQAVTDKLVEAHEKTAKKANDVVVGAQIAVDEAKSDTTKIAQGFAETADKKIEDIKQSTEEAKTKTHQAVKSVVDVGTKKLDHLKKETVDAVGQKIDDVAKAKDDVITFATKGAEDVKKDVQATVEKGKESVVDTSARVVDVTTKKLDEVDKVKDDTLDKAAKKAEHAKTDVQNVFDVTAGQLAQTFMSADKAKDDFQHTAGQKIGDLQKDTHDIWSQFMTEAEEVKDSAKAVSTQKADDLHKAKDKAIEDAQETARSVKDSAAQKVDDLSKAVSQDVDDFSKAKNNMFDDFIKVKETAQKTATEKVDDVKQIKGRVEDSVAKKADDLSKAASQKIDDFAKAKEDAKDAAAQKIEELTQAKDKVKDAAATRVDEFATDLSQKVDDMAKVKETSKDTVKQKLQDFSETAGQKLDGVAKAKQDAQDAAARKVDELAKAKEDIKLASTAKADDFTKAALQKFHEFEKNEEALKETSKQTIDDVKEKAAQKIDDVSKAQRDAQDAATQKLDDVAKVTRETKSATVAKADDFTKLVSQKIDDVAKVKKDVEDAVAKKVDDVAKTASQKKESVEKIIAKKADEVSKVGESAESTVASKVSDLNQQASQKAEAIAKVKDVAVDKVQTATKKVDDVVSDLGKVKDSSKDLLKEKADDLNKVKLSAVEDAGNVKEKIVDTTTQKICDFSELDLGQIIDFTETRESVKDAGAQKIEHFTKAKESAQKVLTEKVDDLSKTASQKAEKLAKAKDTAKEIAAQKVADLKKVQDTALSDFAKGREKILGTAVTQAEDLSKSTLQKDLTETKESAIADLAKLKDRATHQLSEKVDDVEKAREDALQELFKIGESAKVTSAQVTSDLSKITTQKGDDFAEAKERAIYDLSKIKDSVADSVAKTAKGVAQKVDESVESKKSAVDDHVKIKETVADATSQKIDSFTKTKESAVGDLTKAKDAAATKVKTSVVAGAQKVEDVSKEATQQLDSAKTVTSQKIDDVTKAATKGKEQAKDKLDGLGKVTTDFFSTFKGTASDTAEEEKKQTESRMAELEDELSKLTSSLEQLTESTLAVEKAKSYVTSPTMARRAESQRFSREERPTVREVRSVQADEETDEDQYTVTEPEEAGEPKRRPLFHIESEDDDSLDAGKLKERRDSVKSNVLETLGEDKLDNLLSDLEEQLVKDLDRSVAEGKEKVESKVTKAEVELETLTKDSQADVEQIEQKLRDLDKALDSLEQASDPKLEKKLHRVERKFERMASEVMENDVVGTSPTEVEARRENEFQKLVSQLSTEEVSDFQKEYSHLWDETTFSKSDDWDSKTPDSQVDVQELPQGEVVYLGPVTLNKDNLINKAGIEVDVIPIMRSPCHTPRPTKKNKRAKSAMDFYEGTSPPKDFDRGSLPDLKRNSLKGSLVSTIIELNPDRFLYGSTTSLRSTASSSSELSKGEIMNAVLDWLDKSNRTNESSVETASIASSDSNLSQLSAKTYPVVPTIRITKGNGKKRSKRKGKLDRRGEESSFAATGGPQDSILKVEGEESTSGDQQTDQTSSQQRSVADQHQLSEEMKQLLKELEKESKQ